MSDKVVLEKLFSKIAVDLGAKQLRILELETKLGIAESGLKESQELYVKLGNMVKELAQENKRLKVLIDGPEKDNDAEYETASEPNELTPNKD